MMMTLACTKPKKKSAKNSCPFSWYAFSCGGPEMHLGCAKILLTLSSDANISSRLTNMGTFKSPHKAFLEEVFFKHFVIFNYGKKPWIKSHF